MTILVAINNSLNCHELWSQKSKVGGVKEEKKCLLSKLKYKSKTERPKGTTVPESATLPGGPGLQIRVRNQN